MNVDFIVESIQRFNKIISEYQSNSGLKPLEEKAMAESRETDIELSSDKQSTLPMVISKDDTVVTTSPKVHDSPLSKSKQGNH